MVECRASSKGQELRGRICNTALACGSEDDIIALVHEGAQEGTLEDTEKELITNIFTFTDRRVRSVMTPRPQIVAVRFSAPFATILEVAAQAGYSRLPVYQQTLDDIWRWRSSQPGNNMSG